MIMCIFETERKDTMAYFNNCSRDKSKKISDLLINKCSNQPSSFFALMPSTDQEDGEISH